MALRSARAKGRAGFFFELVLALVARGMFSLLVKRFALRAGAPVARGRFSFSVKWLCAPRGPEAELVFSLNWFSRWWRGAVFSLAVKWLALRAGQR